MVSLICRKKLGLLIRNAFIVDDEIVIKIIKNEVEKFEKRGQHWVVSGFPRTKVQALSLQKMGIIPDRFMYLDVRRQFSELRIQQNCINIQQTLLSNEEQKALAAAIYDEYDLHMNAVKETFKQFIYTLDVNE